MLATRFVLTGRALGLMRLENRKEPTQSVRTGEEENQGVSRPVAKSRVRPTSKKRTSEGAQEALPTNKFPSVERMFATFEGRIRRTTVTGLAHEIFGRPNQAGCAAEGVQGMGTTFWNLRLCVLFPAVRERTHRRRARKKEKERKEGE